LSAVCGVEHFPSVSGQITDGGVDLRQGDLH
jgi:hypothetical protein